MEASNSEEPFNNVEEGLKISHFTVYNQAQNSLQIGLKYYARKEAYKRGKEASAKMKPQTGRGP